MQSHITKKNQTKPKLSRLEGINSFLLVAQCIRLGINIVIGLAQLLIRLGCFASIAATSSRVTVILFALLLLVDRILHDVILCITQNLSRLFNLLLLLKHFLHFAEERRVLAKGKLKVFVFDLLTARVVRCAGGFKCDGLHKVCEDFVEDADRFGEGVLDVAVRVEELRH